MMFTIFTNDVHDGDEINNNNHATRKVEREKTAFGEKTVDDCDSDETERKSEDGAKKILSVYHLFASQTKSEDEEEERKGEHKQGEAARFMLVEDANRLFQSFLPFFSTSSSILLPLLPTPFFIFLPFILISHFYSSSLFSFFALLLFSALLFSALLIFTLRHL